MTLAPPCSLADLLVLLPYQVGFRLVDALVVVALDGPRVDLVERVDIPREGVLDPNSLARMVAGVSSRCSTSLLVLAYADDLDPEPALAHLVAVLGAALGDDPPVARVAVASRGRWREPPNGRWSELPDPADVPVVAEYVGRGVSPLPGRHALVTMLRADPTLVATAPVADRARPGLDEGIVAWERLAAGNVDDSDREDLRTILAFLTEVGGRDALLARLVPLGRAVGSAGGCVVRHSGGHPRSHGHEHGPGGDPAEGGIDVLARRSAVRGALIRLVQASPPSLRATTLTVLGAWAWNSGDGALASVATALALQEDPGCSLAGVVARLVELGVRPPCEV